MNEASSLAERHRGGDLLGLVFVGVIWSLIDGILLLLNRGADAQGHRLRDV